MTPTHRVRRSSPTKRSIVSVDKTLPLRIVDFLYSLVGTFSSRARWRRQQLLFLIFVDQSRTTLDIPTTIVGPFVSCVPVLTMVAARVNPQQDAYGAPCMPKPRRKLSLHNDNAISIGHLFAYPSSTAGLSILVQVKKPGISTIKSPDE